MADIKKPYAYSITPLYHSDDGGGFATACMMTCMVSGKTLSSSGGGGYFISPEVFEQMRLDELNRHR